MFNIGAGELLVILVIALIAIGPQKLPGFARQIGRGLGKIRRLISSFQQEIQAAADLPVEAEARKRGSDSEPPRARPGSGGEDEAADTSKQTEAAGSLSKTTSGDKDEPE